MFISLARRLPLIILISLGLNLSHPQSWAETLHKPALNTSADSRNMVEIGRMGSENFHTMAVEGNYAYVSVLDVNGPHLEVINVSDPTQPQKYGQNLDLFGSFSDLVISGNRVYGTVYDVGLQILDISDPSRPTPIGFYNTPGAARSLVISGDFAYIADGESGLQILNIVNPNLPTLVGAYALSGYATDVVVQNNLAYITWGHCDFNGSTPCGGLRVIDITNPAYPTEIGSYAINGSANEVAISGQVVYLVDVIHENHKMFQDRIYTFHAIDASSVSNMVELDSFVMGGSCCYPFGASIFDALSEIEIAGSWAYVALGDTAAHRVNISDPSQLLSAVLRSSASDVSVSGEYIYISDGANGLHVLNVTTPTNPVEVTLYDTPSFVRSVAVDQNYIYFSDQNGLWVADAANPSGFPSGFSAYPQGGRSQSIAITDTYAFVSEAGYKSTTTSIVRVTDVSNPVSPTQASSFDTPYMDTFHVAVVGNYAYLADGVNGLRIINIAVPNYPYEIGFFDTPGLAFEVAISGTLAYVSDGSEGVQIINISDPTNPAYLSTYSSTYGVGHITVDGNYLYITEGSGSTQIVDVSNPFAPTQVSAVFGGASSDILVVGGYIYITTWASIVVWDVSNPMAPTYVDTYYPSTSGLNQLASDGNLLYVATANGLQLLNTTDPAALAPVGYFTTTFQVVNIDVFGNYAYLTGGGYGDMYVIDVSDPVSPTQVGFYNQPGYLLFNAIAVTGSYIFLVDEFTGLNVVDVSTPAMPTWVAGYKRAEDGYGIDIAGNYAYLVTGSDGLRVLDISNPLEITEAGYVALPGFAWEVAVAGNYAYMAVDEEGLQIVDISTPTMPLVVGSYDTPGQALDVAIGGIYAYVADGEAGLQILDISSPLTPTFKNNYATDGGAYVITVADDHAYFADGLGGVRALYIGDPIYPVEVGFYSKGYDVTSANGNIYAADGGVAVLRLTAIAITTTPAVGGLITYTDTQGLSTILQIPPGALTTTTTLLYEPASPMAHNTMAFAGHAFNLVAYQMGVEQPSFTFGSPITLTQSYNEFDVRSIIDENELMWHWWNSDAWGDAATTCAPPTIYDRNPGANWLTLPICRSGKFALLGPSHNLFLPLLHVFRP